MLLSSPKKYDTYTAGWGNAPDNFEHMDILKENLMQNKRPVVKPKQCQKQYDGIDMKRFFCVGEEFQESFAEGLEPLLKEIIQRNTIKEIISFGLKLLIMLVRVNPEYSINYQQLLEYPDINVQRKTHKLLYEIANGTNVNVVCAKLLTQLETSFDKFWRSEVISMILNLLESNSCMGDIGGPYMVQMSNKRYYSLGLALKTRGCTKRNNYSIFLNLLHPTVSDWLSQVLDGCNRVKDKDAKKTDEQ